MTLTPDTLPVLPTLPEETTMTSNDIVNDVREFRVRVNAQTIDSVFDNGRLHEQTPESVTITRVYQLAAPAKFFNAERGLDSASGEVTRVEVSRTTFEEDGQSQSVYSTRGYGVAYTKDGRPSAASKARWYILPEGIAQTLIGA